MSEVPRYLRELCRALMHQQGNAIGQFEGIPFALPTETKVESLKAKVDPLLTSVSVEKAHRAALARAGR